MDRNPSLCSISLNQKIACKPEKIIGCLWDIQTWTRFWAPLHKAEILYDDGRHQDFTLLLEWQASRVSMRTVRFLTDRGEICFFSPQPPPPLTVHQGVWQCVPDDTGHVILKALRWFRLPLLRQESKLEYESRLNHFCLDFRERLQKLLEKIGEACEK